MANNTANSSVYDNDNAKVVTNLAAVLATYNIVNHVEVYASAIVNEKYSATVKVPYADVLTGAAHLQLNDEILSDERKIFESGFTGFENLYFGKPVIADELNWVAAQRTAWAVFEELAEQAADVAKDARKTLEELRYAKYKEAQAMQGFKALQGYWGLFEILLSEEAKEVLWAVDNEQTSPAKIAHRIWDINTITMVGGGKSWTFDVKTFANGGIGTVMDLAGSIDSAIGRIGKGQSQMQDYKILVDIISVDNGTDQTETSTESNATESPVSEYEAAKEEIINKYDNLIKAEEARLESYSKMHQETHGYPSSVLDTHQYIERIAHLRVAKMSAIEKLDKKEAAKELDAICD